jgi:hypothetical protein
VVPRTQVRSLQWRRRTMSRIHSKRARAAL